MSTKSILPILLSFLLFSGVIFAQGEPLNLEQIKEILTSGSDMTTLASTAAEFGYKPLGAFSDSYTQFSNGSHIFSLRIKDVPVYSEESNTRERVAQIIREARESGMDKLPWETVIAYGDDTFVVGAILKGDRNAIQVHPILPAN